MMLTTQKLSSAMPAYWATVLLVVALAFFYGREATAWLLMKLYDFFIIGALK